MASHFLWTLLGCVEYAILLIVFCVATVSKLYGFILIVTAIFYFGGLIIFTLFFDMPIDKESRTETTASMSLGRTVTT